MSYGLKVSKAGYNVLTTGNANLSFNSALATHSIYSVVDKEIEASATGTVTETIEHNLGFVPKVWVFYDDGSYLHRAPFHDWINGIGVDYYIDDTDVYIMVTSGTETYDFKVVIFTRSPSV